MALKLKYDYGKVCCPDCFCGRICNHDANTFLGSTFRNCERCGGIGILEVTCADCKEYLHEECLSSLNGRDSFKLVPGFKRAKPDNKACQFFIGSEEFYNRTRSIERKIKIYH